MKECNICKMKNCRMIDRTTKLGRIALRSNSPCHKAVLDDKKWHLSETRKLTIKKS